MRKDSGQTLLLTVLIIAGVIMMVASISGLIMSYAIRQVTNAQASTQAIFAADAGIECVLYYHFCNNSVGGSSCPAVDCSNPVISNPWSLNCGPDSTRYRQSTNAPYLYTIQCANSSPNYQTWVSIGQDSAGTTARSLQITITQKF
ncbi:MAG: hypothetical protein KGJ01_03215 [Patescibacteria group bacterium]|nr:hypothetical protein [Patescibacteria group bacterium]